MNLQPISYLNFNRQRFIRILKKRIDVMIPQCKLYKTDNLKLAQLNYKRIIDLINETLKRKIIFDNNNIFLLIQYLETYQEFLDEFCNSIKETNDIVSLKDRQISFFTKQSELEKFLKNNFSDPKPIILQKS